MRILGGAGVVFAVLAAAGTPAASAAVTCSDVHDPPLLDTLAVHISGDGEKAVVGRAIAGTTIIVTDGNGNQVPCSGPTPTTQSVGTIQTYDDTPQGSATVQINQPQNLPAGYAHFDCSSGCNSVLLFRDPATTMSAGNNQDGSHFFRNGSNDTWTFDAPGNLLVDWTSSSAAHTFTAQGTASGDAYNHDTIVMAGSGNDAIRGPSRAYLNVDGGAGSNNITTYAGATDFFDQGGTDFVTGPFVTVTAENSPAAVSVNLDAQEIYGANGGSVSVSGKLATVLGSQHDDRFFASARPTQQIDAKGGNDSLDFSGAPSGLTVDLLTDGLSGFETIIGTDQDDTIDAGNGPETIIPGRGHDTVLARGGNDAVDAIDGGPDTVDCGTGTDTAQADPGTVDSLTNCETIQRDRTPPAATTGVASPREDSATLAGSVDPANEDTTYWFEYGTTTSYGSRTSNQHLSASSGVTDVTAEVSGLTPNTTYHFRLHASNADGEGAPGADATFTTLAASDAPLVHTADVDPATITDTSAQVSAIVDPRGHDTSVHFRYGTTTSYGAVTGDQTAAGGGGQQSINATLSGLNKGVTYHVQAVATSSAGTRFGEDKTFVAQAGQSGGGPQLPPKPAPPTSPSQPPLPPAPTAAFATDPGSQAEAGAPVTSTRARPRAIVSPTSGRSTRDPATSSTRAHRTRPSTASPRWCRAPRTSR